MPRPVRPLPLSLLLASLIGCGGASSQRASAPDAPAAANATFPRPDELARLAAGTPAHLEAHGIEVATWTLAGPFADALAPIPAAAPAPWDALLASGAGGAPVVVTQDMGCVARELGRFHLAHAKSPTETLRRFISGWCGAGVTDADVRFLSGEVPAEVDEAEVFQQWHDQALAMVAASTGKDHLLGVWFGREGSRAVLAIAHSRPRVRLEPLASAPDADGQVVLRGTVLTPTDRVTVRVNRGRLGVAECVLDDGVAAPAFVARCALDPADASAWIELSAFAPGRILGTSVLRVLARRPHAKPAYALGDDLTGDPAGAGDASAKALLGLVNDARRAASVPPLVLADAEARRAATLAPYYFADSQDGGAGDKADRIALGLMAGWDVNAMVTGASVYSAMVHSDAPRQLVAACLDSPSGRAVLLDPRATHLAVGSVQERALPALAGLFVTYQTIPEGTGADAETGFELVRAARVARGLPAPTPFDGLGERITRVVARLRSGDMTPQDAEDHLLAHAVRTSGRSNLRGRVVETFDLATLKLPDEVFAPGELSVIAVATPYRPEGEPWWRWTLIVVVGGP